MLEIGNLLEVIKHSNSDIFLLHNSFDLYVCVLVHVYILRNNLYSILLKNFAKKYFRELGFKVSIFLKTYSHLVPVFICVYEYVYNKDFFKEKKTYTQEIVVCFLLIDN